MYVHNIHAFFCIRVYKRIRNSRRPLTSCERAPLTLVRRAVRVYRRFDITPTRGTRILSHSTVLCPTRLRRTTATPAAPSGTHRTEGHRKRISYHSVLYAVPQREHAREGGNEALLKLFSLMRARTRIEFEMYKY